MTMRAWNMVTWLATAVVVCGMPMPEMAPVTIEGDIEEVSWHAEQQLKGLPGMSGSAGRDRTVAAHYRVKLVNTVASYAEDAPGFRAHESGRPVQTRIDHAQDDGYLAKGMRIRIVDFREQGDEGGVRARFSRIEIISKPAED